MEKELNEMQNLRLELMKKADFNLDEAEKAYNFIMGAARPREYRPDGIYFIMSADKMIHKSVATITEMNESIAVGVKLGGRFANVMKHESVQGACQLCKDKEIPDVVNRIANMSSLRAVADWDGFENTAILFPYLSEQIPKHSDQYIPSLAELQLIYSHLLDVNVALSMAGGNSLIYGEYWSSSLSACLAWYLDLRNGKSDDWYVDNEKHIRLSLKMNLNL